VTGSPNNGDIARESGRSSIPETSVMESRGRGVLDAPAFAGHDDLPYGWPARFNGLSWPILSWVLRSLARSKRCPLAPLSSPQL